MKLLIVGAMDSEIDFIKNKLENLKEEVHNNFVFYLGNIKNKEIILVKSGIGRVMSAVLITTAINNYSFDFVINVGVAGGIKGTNVGDIIVGQKYVYGDVNVTPAGYEFGQMARFPRFFTSNINLSREFDADYILGDICTCDSFTTSEKFVNELNEKYFNDLNIKCFDMESTAFAQTCYYFNIPFIAIRSISDVIGNTNQSEQYEDNEILSANKVNEFLYKLIEVM